MNRRGFLRALGLGAAGFALDPERLLWVPGKVATFDVGSWPGGWCTADASTTFTGGNTFLTVDMITQETLRVLANNLEFSRVMNRMYEDPLPAVGQTVRVGRPSWR